MASHGLAGDSKMIQNITSIFVFLYFMVPDKICERKNEGEDASEKKYIVYW